MLLKLLVQVLIFSLCGFPVNSYAGPEGEIPSSESATLKAQVDINTATGKIVAPGTGDGTSLLVAVEVTNPDQVEAAVRKVISEVEAAERAAGGNPDGVVDETTIITRQNDLTLEGKTGASRLHPSKLIEIVEQPIEHILHWRPLGFRITVIGIMSIAAFGATYLQMVYSNNPLESAVALWVAPYVAGILAFVEFFNAQMKTFVQKGKGLITRLFELVTWNARAITNESKAYQLFRMFSNNSEINFWLFAVFKFLLLTAINLRAHGSIDEAIAALPDSWRHAYILSIGGSALLGTLVSFPTSQVTYYERDQEDNRANGDRQLLDRSLNRFNFRMSGALTLRALCMTGIILGTHELVNSGFSLIPCVVLAGGLAGMGQMFRMSVRRLKEIARMKACALETAEVPAPLKKSG